MSEGIKIGTRVKVLDYKGRYGVSDYVHQIGTVVESDKFMSVVTFGYNSRVKLNNLALFSLFTPGKEKREKE